MKTEYFKEKFTDDCNKYGVIVTFPIPGGYAFGARYWGVVDKCTISDDVAILNVVDMYERDSDIEEYKFTDWSLLDNVNKVVLCINGEIVEDAKWYDASWSYKMFLLEVDF